MTNILVTGCAGFIGNETTRQLLKLGKNIIGIDNLNDYYDVNLKYKRLEILKKYNNFKFLKIDLENYNDLEKVFTEDKIDAVINLAARAGVRYSIENPFVYVRTNEMGNLNLLELCKKNNIKKYIFASTSSLYAGQKMPFSETLAVNTPISPYAASKKSAEMMCYTYHYLFGLDISILRFFTVYGPMGRPDMSVFRFIKWMWEDKPLEIFGDGKQKRDFTYITDISRGIIAALKLLGFEIINLGGHKSNELIYMIKLIEDELGKKENFEFKEFNKADIMATWADVEKAKKLLNWESKVSLEEGIKRTVQWWKDNSSWLSDIEI